jgi:hypothetical protein
VLKCAKPLLAKVIMEKEMRARGLSNTWPKEKFDHPGFQIFRDFIKAQRFKPELAKQVLVRLQKVMSYVTMSTGSFTTVDDLPNVAKTYITDMANKTEVMVMWFVEAQECKLGPSGLRGT